MPLLGSRKATEGGAALAPGSLELPETAISASKLSPALQAALGSELDSVVARGPPVAPPEALITDRPLAHYYISSSHNTYLSAHQLYGKSDASQYGNVIRKGARCVEIDAWDDESLEDGLKVVHGWTLTSNISFRAACEEIKKAMLARPQGLPIIVSLECHAAEKGQRRMAEVMREVWGDLVVAAPLEGAAESISLERFRGRILVKVEQEGTAQPADDSSSDEEDKSSEAQAHKTKRKAAKSRITPELAAIGIYTRSVKPTGDDWLTNLGERASHLVANISESALGKYLPARSDEIVRHNSKCLARVYPKGTRISSRNLDPVAFWHVGAQIVALNWQSFDRALQLNTALFAGSDGFVLKPTAPHSHAKRQVSIELVGACNLGKPSDVKAGECLEPYVTVVFAQRARSESKRCKTVKRVKGDLSEGTAPMWRETIVFDYDDEPLQFVRFKLVHDDRGLSRDDLFALAAIRLDWAQDGFHCLPLRDIAGAPMPDAALVIKISRS